MAYSVEDQLDLGRGKVSGREVHKIWAFESGPGSISYETVQFCDGTTLCNCFGWKKKNSNGERSCRHTRMVSAGTADDLATRVKVYQPLIEDQPEYIEEDASQVGLPLQPEPVKNSGAIMRKFNFSLA